MKVFVRILILLAITAGILACMRALGQGSLTARESALLSIVLTGLSILASWVVSEMYSSNQHRAAIQEVQEAHRTNLRTYALKAAEKVTNLSNELNRLSTYLQQELDYTDYRSSEEELQAKEERLESAIHLINTLKSVNDTSLSDWQGVIGDELEQQREEKHEREQEFRAALAHVEDMLLTQAAEIRTREQPAQDIRAEIESIRRDLRLMLTAASGISVPFFHRGSRSSRQTVESKCPVCGAAITYKQRSTGARIKAVRCAGCQSRLAAQYDEQKGHYLALRTPIVERFSCPSCGAEGQAELDPVPGGSIVSNCTGCGCVITLVRATDGVKVRIAAQPGGVVIPLSSEIIEQVRSKLPPQPWPTGVHKKIALDLNIPLGTARRAVTELIRSGDFLPQADGKILDAPSVPRDNQ